MKIENEKLIYYVLTKHNLKHRIDDLYDIGLIGLVKGNNSYDASKNAKKSTYLCNCIKNEIFNELRKEKRDKRQADIIPIETQHLENISNDINIEANALSQEKKNDLYRKLFKLPIYEQYVLYQIFFNNKTQKEIASHLCIKTKEVNLLKKEGLKMMRELYKK